jgi:hypothetical protein
MIFGTFKRPEDVADRAGEWSNTVAVGSVDDTKNINDATANAYLYNSPLSFNTVGSSMATAVPSAITVQILNPEALQTTNGVIYAGIMSTQAAIGGRSQTWQELFDSFVNYMSPRLLSAAKLSLRGVQMSSYPLNMNPVSEFTELMERADQAVVMTEAIEEPCGWAPMLVYNPNGVSLEYLVTTEWRVRFDLQNAASAGHSHHPIHSDGDWQRLMQQATSMGHGAMDIAEVVANVGAAAEVFARMPRIP